MIRKSRHSGESRNLVLYVEEDSGFRPLLSGISEKKVQAISNMNFAPSREPSRFGGRLEPTGSRGAGETRRVLLRVQILSRQQDCTLIHRIIRFAQTFAGKIPDSNGLSPERRSFLAI